MAAEKPLAKAAEILHESWSILSREHWWNDFFGGCSQRLAALFFFCNWKPLFKPNEDISSSLRDEILTNFLSHFGSLGQEFLRPPFWTRRRPFGRGCFCTLTCNLVPRETGDQPLTKKPEDSGYEGAKEIILLPPLHKHNIQQKY